MTNKWINSCGLNTQQWTRQLLEKRNSWTLQKNYRLQEILQTAET